MLHMFFISQPEDRMKKVPTILFFHGNAGNMGHRYDIIFSVTIPYSAKSILKCISFQFENFDIIRETITKTEFKILNEIMGLSISFVCLFLYFQATEYSRSISQCTMQHSYVRISRVRLVARFSVGRRFLHGRSSGN